MPINTNLDILGISPFKEMAAYEAIWKSGNTSFKSLSTIFSKSPELNLSDIVPNQEINEMSNLLDKLLSGMHYNFGALFRNTFDYPLNLNDAREKLQLLYYAGSLDYLYTKGVAVVGTRNPSNEGLKRTENLVKYLVKDNFTIISGLAKGIDTKAHITALNCTGRTIAVIGTPLNISYPKENTELQKKIATEHLLVSQVPFYRHSLQTPNGNKLFFPERNKTMSAISLATVIVEASDTSGTLIQARAALEQRRKLFILDSCFNNRNISWPHKYEKMGAIRVKEYEDIRKHLKNESHQSN